MLMTFRRLSLLMYEVLRYPTLRIHIWKYKTICIIGMSQAP